MQSIKLCNTYLGRIYSCACVTHKPYNCPSCFCTFYTCFIPKSKLFFQNFLSFFLGYMHVIIIVNSSCEFEVYHHCALMWIECSRYRNNTCGQDTSRLITKRTIITIQNHKQLITLLDY